MAQAVVAPEYGAPSVLSLVDIDVPAPEAGRVSVQMKAVGLNPYDYKVFTGLYGSDPAKLPLRVGNEGSGIVTAVSEGAESDFGPIAVGDEVVINNAGGLLATEVTVRASSITPKPSEVSFEQAAALLLAGTTAWDLVESSGIERGNTVLVHGASGGVGYIAAQLAVAKGARVIGTASASRHPTLVHIRVEPVLYGKGLDIRLSTIVPHGVDIVLDASGSADALAVSLDLVSDPAKIFSVALEPDEAAAAGVVRLPTGRSNEIRREARKPLLDRLADGSLQVLISDTFPLEKVQKAYELVGSGHAGGKVVVTL